MRAAQALGVVLLAVSCTAPLEATEPAGSSPATSTTEFVTTTTTQECGREPTEASYLAGDPAELALALSQATLVCSDAVVLASGDPDTLLAAAQLAVAVEAPLLSLDDPSWEGEVVRLRPAEVFVVGETLPPRTPPRVDTFSLSADGAVSEAANRRGVPLLPAGSFRPTAGLVTATVGGSAVIEGPIPPATGDDISYAAINDEGEGAAWLVPYDRPDLLAPVLATAGRRGESVLLVDPAELRNDRHLLAAVRSGRRVIPAGNFEPALLDWQLPALLTAPELPGGGLLLFPGRRLVALYGNPTTPALGVLGEQGPAESVARASEVAAGYEADGTPIVLAFEIIATVASAGPTADGNYSEEMSPETLRPWIDLAAERGVYVILDLQPGRTDFLTQAQLYEEFLRLPHVGLALDPEWRLEPDQVHLRQIGSVEAAEVNQVSEWLAELVRTHNLAQKLFLLHQFHLDMLANREQIVTRPELATVIQMDGQGPVSTKYDTWAALTADRAALDVDWGWKNFYDEDIPRGGATAAEVLALEPVPVYVSFQ